MVQAMSSHKHRLVRVDQELRFKVWPADSAHRPILFHVQVGQTWLVGVVVKVVLVRGYPKKRWFVQLCTFSKKKIKMYYIRNLLGEIMTVKVIFSIKPKENPHSAIF